MAELFFLELYGDFRGTFRHITFAILEHDESILWLNESFRQVFARPPPPAASPPPQAWPPPPPLQEDAQEKKAVSFDCAYGCLLGGAVGDAAGAVLEFTSFGKAEVLKAMQMPGGGVFAVGPGQVGLDDGHYLPLGK